MAKEPGLDTILEARPLLEALQSVKPEERGPLVWKASGFVEGLILAQKAERRKERKGLKHE